MIHKLMIGRLGNQMFQYATVRAMQLRYYPNDKINLNFKLVYDEGEKEKGFFNQLEDFSLCEHMVDGKVQLSLVQGFYFMRYIIGYKLLKKRTKGDYELEKREYEKRIQREMQRNGLFVFNYGYCRFEKTKKKNKLFVGFFESAKYFDDIRDVLLKEFTPKREKLKKNERLYERIETSESVCVSIRRGDFLDAEHRDKNYICTPEYFDVAIKEIKRRVKMPQFIVFSDDVKWCKENMNFPEETLYEDGDDPVWEKLRLMYSCKHFIISNSTFSWWAQYLSRNDHKVVVAPKKWKNDGFNEDIYQDGWILV